MTNRNALWRRVVVSKYEEGNHFWFPKKIYTTYGVRVWKGVRKGWDSFARNLSFDIGNGSIVSF